MLKYTTPIIATATPMQFYHCPLLAPLQYRVQETRHIAVLTYPGCYLGGIISLLEMITSFNVVNLHRGRQVKYQIQLYSMGGGPLASLSTGHIHIETISTAGSPPQGLDLLIIAHGYGAAEFKTTAALSAWLRCVCDTTRQVVVLGSGAFILAASGVLNNRQVTTHSRFADRLSADYPHVEVVTADTLHVDGNVISINEHFSLRELAVLLLRETPPPDALTAMPLAVALRRNSNSRIMARVVEDPGSISRRVIVWWLRHLANDITMTNTAASLAMSERSFRRHFTLETGYSPSVFLQMLRLEIARQALISTKLPIDKIARRGGLHDGQQLARLFRKIFVTSPNRYRLDNGRSLFPGVNPLYAALFNGRTSPEWLRRLIIEAG